MRPSSAVFPGNKLKFWTYTLHTCRAKRLSKPFSALYTCWLSSMQLLFFFWKWNWIPSFAFRWFDLMGKKMIPWHRKFPLFEFCLFKLFRVYFAHQEVPTHSTSIRSKFDETKISIFHELNIFILSICSTELGIIIVIIICIIIVNGSVLGRFLFSVTNKALNSYVKVTSCMG